MDTRIEKVSANTIRLEITVTAEDFKKGIEKAYRKNAEKFNIPGFRKGKAPQAMIEKMYGEEVFYEDAVNIIIDETYPKAIEENSIEPVDRPEVDISDIGRDKNLVYTATVTVKPEVELGEYKGIEVEKIEYPVTDDDVEKQITSAREKNARIIVKEDGVIEKGDIAVIDFEGFVDDVPFEGGKDSNYQLEIGSGTFIEGFEDQLIGKKAGDETEVKVTFPEDYKAENLAGKPAIFKVKVNEIKNKELVPLDDEFAKDVSEFETLEEYRNDIRKKLQENNEHRAKHELEDAIVKKAVDNSKVEIPDVMIDREVDYMIEDIRYRLNYQGLTLEQYAQFLNTSIDDMKKEYRDTAYNRVKTHMVLEKIGKTEALDASDEEIDAEIEKTAKQYNQDFEKLKNSMRERERNIIKGDIINNKTVDFLVQNSRTTA